MSKRRKAKAIKAARDLPANMQNVVFSKWSPKAERMHRNRKLGKFGAASEVRQIDPSEYVIDGK